MAIPENLCLKSSHNQVCFELVFITSAPWSLLQNRIFRKSAPVQRTMTRGASANSYTVTSGGYGGYNNAAYNREMSEFNAGGKNDPYNFNGTYNKNGGLKAVTPPQYSYNGNNAPPPGPPTNGLSHSRTVEDEDDVEDRGHWGSKAEFILSCIGFSVSVFPAAFSRKNNLFFKQSLVLKKSDALWLF